MSITKKERNRVSVSTRKRAGDAAVQDATVTSKVTKPMMIKQARGSCNSDRLSKASREEDHISTTIPLVLQASVFVMLFAVGIKTNPWTTLYLVILALILNQGWQRAVARGIHTVCSSSELQHDTASLSSTIQRISSKTWESSCSGAVSAISADECFVSMDEICHLTLRDITAVFQYAMDPATFPRASSPLVKLVLEQMDAAVATSRGHVPASCAMDALRFCAAVRVFSEWRPVRQVPDGYKAYAVGMSLGRRDIVQNLAKLEHAVHDYVASHNTSPSLRDLLQHELDANIHTRLPRLKDKTAAMGLLWVLRQLQYQACVYTNVSMYESSKEAVSAAYEQVYGRYHGWAVKKMFNYSFQGAPPAEEIFKHMNPTLLRQLTKQAEQQQQGTDTVSSCSETNDDDDDDDDESFQFVSDDEEEWEDIPNLMETSFLSEMSFLSDSTDDFTLDRNEQDTKKNPFEKFGQDFVNGWNQFGKDVEKGWSDICSGIVGLFDKDHRQKQRRERYQSRSGKEAQSSARKTTNATSLLQTRDNIESYISREMAADAHRHIATHLQVMEPMVQELISMMEELNMNDPTIV